MSRKIRCTASQKERREAIERELDGLEPLSLKSRKINDVAGFIGYFLRMSRLFPTQIEAYEKLEENHVRLFGKRKYSEFKSFLVVLRRYNKK